MALPTPVTVSTKFVKKTGTPCYVLIYDPVAKKVVVCKYGDFNYSTPASNTVIVSTTYAEIAAEATALTLTGLPAQVDGQP